MHSENTGVQFRYPDALDYVYADYYRSVYLNRLGLEAIASSDLNDVVWNFRRIVARERLESDVTSALASAVLDAHFEVAENENDDDGGLYGSMLDALEYGATEIAGVKLDEAKDWLSVEGDGAPCIPTDRYYTAVLGWSRDTSVREVWCCRRPDRTVRWVEVGGSRPVKLPVLYWRAMPTAPEIEDGTDHEAS